MADSNIPTPDEITRVTEYLQTQAAEAQETIIAAKKASAETAQQTANSLVQNNDVVGVAINRRAWDDETIPWGAVISRASDSTSPMNPSHTALVLRVTIWTDHSR
jgi:hypothetical protein